MTGPTHFLAGLSVAVGGLVVFHQPPGMALPALAVGGLAALLPDLDHPDSNLVKLLGIRILAERMTHRGILHSVFAAFSMFFLATAANTPLFFGLVFFFSYLSHLFLDILNPGGCAVFWPAQVKIRLPLGITGGGLETFAIRPILYILLVILVIIYIVLLRG